MLILDLCGGTGSWSKPYKDAGYEVINVTLPDYDVCKFEPPDNVHGILAAPPCTMFSLARTTAKTPRDLRNGMRTVEACLRIIWECRYRGKLAFWALENPQGILRQFLGRPALTFSPSDYGDRFTKKTDIWGYFKTPRKNPVVLTDGEILACAAHKSCPGIPQTSRDPAKRAITPTGWANAFFKANR
jgi:hypothetical protein